MGSEMCIRDRDGTTVVIKKNVSSILAYLTWEGKAVFQSAWELEDDSTMVFFSNVIRNIETYVKNRIQCPAANIYWFLLFKG